MIFIFILLYTYIFFLLLLLLLLRTSGCLLCFSTAASTQYHVIIKWLYCDVARLHSLTNTRNIFVIIIFYAFLEFNQLKLECLYTAKREKKYFTCDDVDLKDKMRRTQADTEKKNYNEKPDKEFNFFALLFLLNLLLSLPLASFLSC